MQKELSTKRNPGVDFARYICSFMVICIHTTFWGQTYIEPLARFAVPVFFMITGFFYSSTCERNKELTQIKKILMLSVSSHLLYLLWDMMIHLIKNPSIFDYLRSFRNTKIWFEFFILNNSPISEHLWYLNALIYVLILTYLLEKFIDRKRLYKFIPLLLLLNFIAGNYSMLLFNSEFPISYSRNFLSMGLPFFLLGDCVNQKNIKIQNRNLLVIILLSVFGSIAEKLLLQRNGLFVNADCFLSTPFLAGSIFLLIIQNEHLLDNQWISKIALMGRQASTMIYIIHPIMISIVGKVIRTIGIYVAVVPKLYMYFSPVVILFVSTAFYYLYCFVKKRVNRNRQPNAWS